MFTLFYISNFITRLFLLWVALFGFVAWWQPECFVFAKPAILPLLTLIMFAMGLTLKLDDFKSGISTAFRGVAWVIATFLQLEPMMAVD